MSRKSKRDEAAELQAEVDALTPKPQQWMPVKKRARTEAPAPATPSNNRVHRMGDISSDEDDGLNEDLIRDEEDMKHIMSLPELQREEILFQRAERRRDIEERNQLRQRRREELMGVTPKRSREDEKKAQKRALDKLAASKRKKDKYEDDYYDQEDEEEEERPVKKSRRAAKEDEDFELDEMRTPLKEPPATPAPAATPSGHSFTMPSTPVETPKKPRPDMKLEHLMPVIVTRGKLEKWYDEPYWGRVVPRGLFVRIQLGTHPQNKGEPFYKIAEISDLVETTKMYRVGDKECNTNLVVEIAGRTKVLEIKYVSNQPPTELEFEEWLNFNWKRDGHIPSPNDLARLQAQIKHANEYIYTEDDIAEQVRRNQARSKDVGNLAKTKSALEDRLHEARRADDKALVEQLEKELEELILKQKAQAEKQTSENEARLAEVNRKRLLEYSKNLDQTREKILKQQQEELEGKNRDSEDPFARRKTFLSFDFLKKKEEKKEEEEKEDALEGGDSNNNGTQPETAQINLSDLDASGSYSAPATPRAPVVRLVATHKIVPKAGKVISLEEYKKSRM